MVKITGPLGSKSASGSFGKTLTVSSYKGKAYIRRHVDPKNKRTDPQVAMRVMLAFLAQQWATLPPADQATWVALAVQLDVTPFNAYAAHNLSRWRRLKAPSTAYPTTELSLTPSAPTLVALGLVHNAQLTITKGTRAPTWGWLIHRALDPWPGTRWFNLIAAIPYTGSPQIFTDEPLPAGTYVYKIRGFNLDASMVTTSLGQTAIVT